MFQNVNQDVHLFLCPVISSLSCSLCSSSLIVGRRACLTRCLRNAELVCHLTSMSIDVAVHFRSCPKIHLFAHQRVSYEYFLWRASCIRYHKLDVLSDSSSMDILLERKRKSPFFLFHFNVSREITWQGAISSWHFEPLISIRLLLVVNYLFEMMCWKREEAWWEDFIVRSIDNSIDCQSNFIAVILFSLFFFSTLLISFCLSWRKRTQRHTGSRDSLK